MHVNLSGGLIVLVLLSALIQTAMALKGFKSLGCKILSRGTCNCNSFMPISMLCSPSSSSSMKTNPIASAANNLRLRKGKNIFSSGAASSSFPITNSARIFMSSKGSVDNKPTPVGTPEPEDPPEDFPGKIKYMWKNYGSIAIGTYLSVYVVTLSSVFLCVDADVFNAASVGLDPISAIKKVCDIYEKVTGSNSLPGYIRDHPTVGTFAIAWVMTKFTEPLRLGFTVLVVPSVARLFGRGPVAAISDVPPTPKK